MSEKRKPYLTILLKKQGNKAKKIELFEAKLFPNECKAHGRNGISATYRIRVAGKWWPAGEMRFFYMTQIRDALWRSIKNL